VLHRRYLNQRLPNLILRRQTELGLSVKLLRRTGTQAVPNLRTGQPIEPLSKTP
jgi:hypothetical protein